MKKTIILIIIIHFLGGSYLSAQDTLSTGKALNIPTSKYGISIGNSQVFNGIRINIADENVKKINGINITFWLKYAKNQNAIVNGISLGIIPTAGTLQYINLGLLGVGTASNLNGASIGGLIVGSGGNINGFSLSGLMTAASDEESIISGVAISGISIITHKAINGLALGGIVVGTYGEINGIVSSLALISAEKNINGLAFTPGYLKTEIYKGVAIAGYANTSKMNGLSIALFNETEELHGVQFGLINYAKNNPKGLRILPIINFHL